MSLAFSDTSTYKGIIQTIERRVYGQDAIGRISDNATLLKQWTADINLAWDSYLSLVFASDGTWQFDDSNHTDYPFIKTNIVSDQNDYTFTTDENGNLILDIMKVAILKSATDTLYEEIEPIDQQAKDDARDLVSETTATSVPYQYDKTGNAIFLDPTPSYSATNGLKIYINREASYFTSSDTTKKPGCPGNHHIYFALKPIVEYSRFNTVANINLVERELEKVEAQIQKDFARRNKDEEKVITGKKINYI